MSGNPDLIGGRLIKSDHQRLVDGEIEPEDYVAALRDKIDRELGLGRYRGRAEGPVARAKEFQTHRPSLMRRLGTALIEGYNFYQIPEE